MDSKLSYNIFVKYYKFTTDLLVQRNTIVVSTNESSNRQYNYSIKRKFNRLGFQLFHFRNSRSGKLVCGYKVLKQIQPSSSSIVYLVSTQNSNDNETFWTQYHSFNSNPIKVFVDDVDYTYKLTGLTRLTHFAYWYVFNHIDKYGVIGFRKIYKEAKKSSRISRKYQSQLINNRSITFTASSGVRSKYSRKSLSSRTSHSDTMRVQHKLCRPGLGYHDHNENTNCMIGPVQFSDETGHRMYLKIAGLTDINSENPLLNEEGQNKTSLIVKASSDSSSLDGKQFYHDYNLTDNIYHKSLLKDAETLRSAVIYVSMHKYSYLWSMSKPTFDLATYGVLLEARGLPTDIERLTNLINEVAAPYSRETSSDPRPNMSPVERMARYYADLFKK